MNYYYELRIPNAPGQEWPYWCLANCSIADGGHLPHHVHNLFMLCSHRVWLENANGVYLVKPDYYGQRHQVDPHEFTIIKLKARTIEYQSQ